MRWSHAHWSRPFSVPVATNAASAANAADSASNTLLLARDMDPDCGGDDLEPRRRRPDRFAVDLDRQRVGGVDFYPRAAEVVDLRMREVLAVVELRRRREEIELVDVADEDDVEQTVVLARVRGE